MIKVLSVIDTAGPGGAETVFLNTCTALEASAFRTVCVVGREGWLAERLRAKGIAPIILPASGSMNVRYLRDIVRIAHDHDVDLIAAHLYGSAIYSSMAGLLTRKPVVSILHGQSDISEGGRLPRLKKWFVRAGSHRLVFVSDQLRRHLQPILNVPESQCATIPNGIDPTQFPRMSERGLRAELQLDASDILVGAVGNVRAPKSYDVFLRAARILKDRFPHYRFAIAGEGSGPLYEGLLALRSQLRLESDVTFLGLRSDIANVLQSLDIYALSSTTEGFSIACIEAMAAGTPVVATRSGGPEEILEHEKSGLLVPTQDPAALADAVHRVATEPSLAERLRQHALARVRSRYTLELMLDAYGRLFADVVNEQSR